jgi:hypothetical protein
MIRPRGSFRTSSSVASKWDMALIHSALISRKWRARSSLNSRIVSAGAELG